MLHYIASFHNLNIVTLRTLDQNLVQVTTSAKEGRPSNLLALCHVRITSIDVSNTENNILYSYQQFT